MAKESVKNEKIPRPIAASVVKLRAAVEKASAGGGTARVEAQKSRGKFTARERIHYLLDEGTFQELDLLVSTRATDFGLKDKDIHPIAKDAPPPLPKAEIGQYPWETAIWRTV